MNNSLKGAILIYLFFTILTCMASVLPAKAQKALDVYVDKNGVMRWGNTKEEVHGFGINYTAPFAHAYRTAKKLNVDLEKAIDADVYHFARLGFDAFRVHVWDTEICDSVGNLIPSNEHLRLFDYMLMRMEERGMKILLTPIAFWDNGYPEPSEKTPGFAYKYGKDACLTNEAAIQAQENYLFQFLNHVNTYTKVAYKNDPSIVAFEVSNEPHHKGTPADVTTYINRMVKAMRNTGCKKPIFYNISHSIHLSDAYFNSTIQGGTFQWYPTGLGAQHELRGNFLPNVDAYTIPFATDTKFKSMAKIVYEFDAADVGRSYIYPAIARSFRAAGIQWATHFAYDPTYMAYANTEYNTHYMNLVYAPQKALSLKIASEVFHRVPLYKNYGRYPNNASFDVFHVSYQNDLAEMVTDKKFIYTNTTRTLPSQPATLEEVSGFGNSPVVTYEGKGAYFLDKIEKGVWRLEVLPDAIWVDNIFGKNSLRKEVAVTNWRTWPIKIALPDLGNDFSITPLHSDMKQLINKENVFNVRPGVYLLVRKGQQTNIQGSSKWKNIQLDEFSAPLNSVNKTYVIHTPQIEAVANAPLQIKATVVTKEEPQTVTLYGRSSSDSKVIPMNRVNAYDYEASLPAEFVNAGYLSYYITVEQNDTQETFPSRIEGNPTQWDFYNNTPFKVAIVAGAKNLYLFNALTDSHEVSKEWKRGANVVPNNEPGAASLLINLPIISNKDPENNNGVEIFDYSLRYNFLDRIKGRTSELKNFTNIIVRAKSVNQHAIPLQIALVMKDGNAYGGIVTLQDQTLNDYALKLADLKPVKLVTLPRPYPSFLPYYFESGATGAFNITEIETIQVSVGPGIEAGKGADFSFALESIKLN